jgi:hypothetical protein
MLWAALVLLAQEPARVHNLKLLSDRIDDVTTAEAILASFAGPGASDAERAEGLWRATVKYRHQAPPPQELLAADWEAHDPVKLFNVYGYCMCCCTSAMVLALNRLDGREARGRILQGHSVAEVRYGGGWHMYDPSLINWFPKADRAAASVDEIVEAVEAWYEKNPGYRGDGARLRELLRADGWEGWRKGPELLARNPFYTQGWWPARTHSWADTMVEYSRKQGEYEYGYHVGHRALLSLRPGESFVREAGHRGLHVNGEAGWDGLRARAGEGDLVFLKTFFPGYRGGLVGNGVHRYAPDAATLPEVVEMSSPFVYLGGRVRLSGTGVRLALSTNHGRTFEPLEAAGGTADLTPRIRRRYAYWLRVERPAGARLESIVLENDFQHAPRAMAWLGPGENRLRAAADPDPVLATRTVACRITPNARYSDNESSASMGLLFDNLEVADGACWWKGGTGLMDVPVETPGPIAALRLTAQVRVRDAADRVGLSASFDGGRSFEPIGEIVGPTPGITRTFRFDRVPAESRRVLVRFELSGRNTAGVFNFRLDADYRDPAAGFRPFVVTHRWREGGAEKRHEQRVERLPADWTITTAGEPETVSVAVEMPPAGR